MARMWEESNNRQFIMDEKWMPKKKRERAQAQERKRNKPEWESTSKWSVAGSHIYVLTFKISSTFMPFDFIEISSNKNNCRQNRVSSSSSGSCTGLVCVSSRARVCIRFHSLSLETVSFLPFRFLSCLQCFLFLLQINSIGHFISTIWI